MSANSQKRLRFEEIPAEKKAALAARAKEVNREHLQRVRHYVNSQKQLLDADADADADAVYAVVVRCRLVSSSHMVSPSSHRLFVGDPSGTLSFTGTDWSFGLAGWGGYGAAAFGLPPNQLSGNGSAVDAVTLATMQAARLPGRSRAAPASA